jgi:hypothetical protein
MVLSLRGLSLRHKQNLNIGAKGNLRRHQVLIPKGIYILLTIVTIGIGADEGGE